jgi:hypothetical protein
VPTTRHRISRHEALKARNNRHHNSEHSRQLMHASDTRGCMAMKRSWGIQSRTHIVCNVLDNAARTSKPAIHGVFTHHFIHTQCHHHTPSRRQTRRRRRHRATTAAVPQHAHQHQRLDAQLRAAPVATLGVVANGVARAHANPLRDRAVLLGRLRQRRLGPEGLVRGHFSMAPRCRHFLLDAIEVRPERRRSP